MCLSIQNVLILVLGHKILNLIVGFTIALRNVRNLSLIPFSKNKYMSVSKISSRSTFIILSIVLQLKSDALKYWLGHNPQFLSYYFCIFQKYQLTIKCHILSTSRDNLSSFFTWNIFKPWVLVYELNGCRSKSHYSHLSMFIYIITITNLFTGRGTIKLFFSNSCLNFSKPLIYS